MAEPTTAEIDAVVVQPDPSDDRDRSDPDATTDDPTIDDGDVTDEAPTPGRRRRRWLRRTTVAVAVVVGVAVAFVAVTNLIVTRSIDGLGYDTAAQVPGPRTAAIVFGAGLVDGKPTPALADRVHGAVELYRQGTVGHLLMTGDNSAVQYDEPTAMEDQAVAEGVPANAITRDRAGFSTYESCLRARDVFGVHDAVLVTQDYHLARALFSCRELGIDAVGLRIPDWQHHAEQMPGGNYYPWLSSQWYMAREWFSRTKTVISTKITHPEPTYLGPYVGLNGD